MILKICHSNVVDVLIIHIIPLSALSPPSPFHNIIPFNPHFPITVYRSAFRRLLPRLIHQNFRCLLACIDCSARRAKLFFFCFVVLCELLDFVYFNTSSQQQQTKRSKQKQQTG